MNVAQQETGTGETLTAWNNRKLSHSWAPRASPRRGPQEPAEPRGAAQRRPWQSREWAEPRAPPAVPRAPRGAPGLERRGAGRRQGLAPECNRGTHPGCRPSCCCTDNTSPRAASSTRVTLEGHFAEASEEGENTEERSRLPCRSSPTPKVLVATQSTVCGALRRGDNSTGR